MFHVVVDLLTVPPGLKAGMDFSDRGLICSCFSLLYNVIMPRTVIARSQSLD